MPVKAIIFDCFGVVITDALDVLRSTVTGGTATEAQFDDIVAASNRGFLEPAAVVTQLHELTGQPPTAIRQALTQAEVKNQPLLEYIAQLRPAYQTALLSNISQAGLRQRFNPAELDKHFDVVVTSGAIGYAKPEPEAYEITADRLGVRLADCLMVDDRQVCIDGALATGMHGWRYTTLLDLKAQLG